MCGNPLYFLLNCSVNLKLLKKLIKQNHKTRVRGLSLWLPLDIPGTHCDILRIWFRSLMVCRPVFWAALGAHPACCPALPLG